MDIFNNLILGFHVAASWEHILFCFIGVLIGTLIGVLPGIGPTTGIAILIPVTFGKWLEAENDRYAVIVKDMGLIKKK